ncbi:saccharopine dehydrogenase NADP-binding domain-containing protein [Frankia sp. AvcI1]|uniref:saccharopine dehydrogenase NADP-binding domain-containing protein n=1 Tax=Frankia sp. AvcI1 TaxID=573496 RepID=UPI0021174640|nr:saccharopine dehydrogenase NADP-binding domain-containing protein [Frankia sp. AvcI1]
MENQGTAVAVAGGTPTPPENFMQSPDSMPPGSPPTVAATTGAETTGAETTGTIVVFGATGYTGRLVTAELVAAGHRPVLAGRAGPRVAALAAAHGGLATAVADAADAAALRRLLRAGDVLVSTVGPFDQLGRPAVAAAAAAGAHYVDCSGEGAFLRHVFADVGPRAAAAGCVLLPGAGFEFVPGNLAGALALHAAGDAARRLDVGYLVSGPTGMSSGTRATLLAALGDGVLVLRDGRLVQRPLAREVRAFSAPAARATPVDQAGTAGRARPADQAVRGARRGALWSGGEAITLPRLAPALTDVSTYFGGGDGGTRAAQALSFPLAGLRRLPPTRAALGALARAARSTSGRGPDAPNRARAGVRVIACARDGAGRELATAALAGHDPYTFTGRIMAWMAGHLAAGTVRRVGALGPVEAFGLADLERAVQAAGLHRVV